MAIFSGNNATFTIDDFSYTTSGTVYYNTAQTTKKYSLSARWIDGETTNKKNGLLFLVENYNDLFCDDPRKRIECLFVDWKEYSVQWDNYELAMLVTGFKTPKRNFPYWNKPVDAGIATRGRIEDGNARHVYEYVGDKHDLGFYAGLTVHDTYGTSSNYPMHEYERIACGAPLEVYPDFDEKFAYVTTPPYMWGLQVQAPAWNKERKIVPFKDRDILDIPLGAHFSMAGPATRLAYFWVYLGALAKEY